MIKTYIILFLVGFIQNMIFTLNSRSRQSANVTKHFWTAILSNGLWFVCTFMLILPEMFKAIALGSMEERLLLLAVYTISTALGSIVMMKINLGHWRIKYLTESGSSHVGAKYNKKE